MIKRTYEELLPYNPPGHFGVTCKRYHGKDETNADGWRFSRSCKEGPVYNATEVYYG